MYPKSEFQSREKVLDFLDSYSFQRKEEIDGHKLQKDSGFLKTYVIEASHVDGATLDIPTVLRNPRWRLNPVGDNNLYDIHDSEGRVGFVEPVSKRYLMIHSYKKTDAFDTAIQKLVHDSSQLDFLWLSGDYFSTLWRDVVLPNTPDRFISMKFEHASRFEDGIVDRPTDDEVSETNEVNPEESTEHRASTSTINERARKISNFLPDLQKSHSAFKAIKMLRIPATTRGGYEFWSWGKVTHRAPSFRDGRDQIISVTELYQKLTLAIEKHLWMHLETVKFRDSESITVRGAPLTIKFNQPLSVQTFRNLIELTFERGQGPLRLWGNPLWLSDKKVHIYGIDLHLWQRIYIEITTQRLTAILPAGTCGNTAHRLLTNFQRFVDPDIEMYIGSKPYSDLLRQVLFGTLGDTDAF